MLVVTRKKDERLVIGDDIEIQVLRIGRENVRLGIKAPAHVSIYRYEIYEAIKDKESREGDSRSVAASAPQSPEAGAAETAPDNAEHLAAPPKARAKTEDR